MQFLAALIVALIAALAGAALRPVFEDHFNARRKRIEINLPPNLVNDIELPYSMRIEWLGEIHKTFYEQVFFVTNRTGATIRNVNLILESAPIQKIEVEEQVYRFDVLIDSVLSNKAIVNDLEGIGLSKIIKIEHLEGGKSIGGRMVSTLAHKPSFRTQEDFELSIVRRNVVSGNNKGIARYSQSLSNGLAGASLVFVILAASGVTENLDKLITFFLGL